MDIDYISDLHLDFYVKPESDLEKYTAKTFAFLQSLLPDQLAEVFILAGDISHYNQQSFDTLQFFSRCYEHVFFVLGNHDYHLVSQKQRLKYHENNVERVEELLELIKPLPNVQLLDQFEIVTHKSIQFAGSTSWYSLHDNAKISDLNDGSIPIQAKDIAAIRDQEMSAYEKMQFVDVLVTHMPPILLDIHNKFGSSACYLNELKEIKANYCLFGHCHDQKVYEKNGITFAINALGYPDEQRLKKIRTLRVR